MLKEATPLGFANKMLPHLVLVCVVGLFIYSNTFKAPFQWDEILVIKDNAIIRNLDYFLKPSSAEGLKYYAAVRNRYVGYLTFALNYRIQGLDVTGYHIFNISVHILNSLLVYFLVGLTFRTPFMSDSKLKGYSSLVAVSCSLLFVSHPVQIEAVTYIFQRLASLVTFFYLLSIVLYVRGRLSIAANRHESPLDAGGGSKCGIRVLPLSLYLLSLFSAILSMKTKENAFTLPVVIVLYEFLFFRGPAGKRIVFLIPMLMTLSIIPMTLMGMRGTLEEISRGLEPATFGFRGISTWDYFFTELRVVVTYLRLLLLPINQNIGYDYPIFHSFLNAQVLVSFLFCCFFLSSGAYLLYRSRSMPDLRLIGFGIFWFFITLSVESSIIPIPMVINEYRVYLPSVGFFVATVSLFFLAYGRLKSANMQKVVLMTLFILPIAFSISSYTRNSLWSNEISLWKDVVKKSPRGAGAHSNLGYIYLSKGLTEMAIEEYQTALRLDPNFVKAHNGLGVAYKSKGHLDMAIEEYQTALRLDPNFAEAHNNLGNIFSSKGLTDMAIAEYQTALRLDPDAAKIYFNLGAEYFSKGLLDMAIEEYQTALRLDPNFAEAHYSLAVVYLQGRNASMARGEVEAALQIKPDLLPARQLLDSILSVKN